MTADTQIRLDPRQAKPKAPGWPELVVAAAAYTASYLLVAVFLPLLKDDEVAGIVGLVVSGLIGLVAFAVAALIRIRGLSGFGIRRARPRHLVVGASLGLVAFAPGTIVAIAYQAVSGDRQNVQDSYQAAAAGGFLSLIFTFVAGSIITPLGEEAFFRGVVANVLLRRLGPWAGVILSAAIFAVAHGLNPVLLAALVVGILTGLLFRWSGSIWPGVLLHGVNNATALFLPVLIAALST